MKYRARLLVASVLAFLCLLVAIPHFAKARRTTSMNSCEFNRMWIETAKTQWAIDHKKLADDSPTEADLLPYLEKIRPMWDRRRRRVPQPLSRLPTCFLTNAPYTLGTVNTRIECPIAASLKSHHDWDETEYRYHYNIADDDIMNRIPRTR